VSTPWVRTINRNLLDEGTNTTISEIEDESVDVIVTSPPYKVKDGGSLPLMHALGKLAGRVLTPGGRVYVNLGQLRENFAMPMQSWAAIHGSSGLQPGQTISLVKSVAIESKQIGHYQPITMKSPTLNYCWEFVFTFFKPPESKIDRLSIGVPFADKSNMKRGDRGKNGDLHCAGDTWFIPYETTGKSKKKAHAYEFPQELVCRCLKVSGATPGMTVLDPFMGSGTTLMVANTLGLNAIGIEINKKTLDGAKKRAKPARTQARLVRPSVYMIQGVPDERVS